MYAAIIILTMYSGEVIEHNDQWGPYQTLSECQDRTQEGVELFGAILNIESIETRCDPTDSYIL